MSQGRILSTGSEASATRGAGKDSTGSGGVLSRVLGSLRRHSDNGGAAANNKEDTDWVNTYKITHRPDRPRLDKREGLKHRNSAYVLGQLHRIWRRSEKMAEAKRRERDARESAFAAGFTRRQDRRNGEDVRSRQGDGPDSSSGTRRPHPPSLRTDLARNFNREAPSPEFARDKRREDSRVHTISRPIPANEVDKGKERDSQSIFSDSSDRMTIRVGLELQSPYSKGGGSGIFKINSGVSKAGGYNHAHNASALSPVPLLAPRSFVPATAPLQSVAPSISPGKKRVGRRRHTRALSHSPTLRMAPASAMRKSNAQARTLRDAMALYINTDRNSTPSLDLNSSPVSERASPLTPIDDASGDEYVDCETPATGPRTSKTCPMPLCDNPLLTPADRKQNLCAECRSELQPRQSVFTTDVLNAFSSPYSPTDVYTSSRASLVSSAQHDLMASATAEELPEMTPYINGEGKSRRTSCRRSGEQSADRDPKTEKPLPPAKVIINNSHILSRFNKDRDEFKLQPVPLSRRDTRRGRKSHYTLPTKHRASRQKVVTPVHEKSHSEDGSSHIGFQLAGWRTLSSSPAPQRSSQDSKPRESSGPLLEPKTFCPAALPAHRQSNSHPRAKEGRASGRSSYLPPPRAPVGKTAERMLSSAPPGSIRHSGSRQQPTPQHRASAPVSKGTQTRETRVKSEGKIAEYDEIYNEIESIIDSYLRLSDVPESANERRKMEAIASYHAVVPLDVEMKIKNFF
ncbi:hypothetical protein GQX73_g9704 [Xylaria multiplex]|uniref:Uncharacterized protein n=1 Tax=Xylaria multiplex TaxID=323545 RepID=A0A7C8IKK4_9PEZI|nr:hypothetical protein GQX73_g9704 [Xylaria multiplex]